MKITFIGQAGLLIEKNDVKIMVDPYLSDSVKEINPANYRRVPVKEELFDIKPDIVIFTHNHLDHFDPETARKFVNENTSATVLSPVSVWNEVRKYGGKNNYIFFNRGTSRSEKGFVITAVRAEHSDPDAIGVVISDGEKKIYITGDTLYNEEIFKDIPEDIYALFLPINGVGNNMNIADAKRFAERVNPRYAVPLHWGMFDNLDPNEFDYEKKIIPKIYEEVAL